MRRAGPNRHHGSAASELLCLHLRAARIDGWEPEYRFHPERRWRFDVAFPAAKLALEVDGGVWTGGRHTTGVGATGDCEKFSHAAILGWRVMRCTPAQVRTGQALRWIEQALGTDAGPSSVPVATRKAHPTTLRTSRTTIASQRGVRAICGRRRDSPVNEQCVDTDGDAA